MFSKMTSSHVLGNALKLFSRNLRQDEYTRAFSSLNNLKACAKYTCMENLLQRSSVKIPKSTAGMLIGSSTSIQCRLSSSHGDHVRMWQLEKITAAIVPVLLPASLIWDNPILDGALALLVVMHTHWGLEVVVVDYARPIILGKILPKIIHLLLYVVSVATLAGLLLLIYNGPGIGKTIKNFWAIGKEESSDKKKDDPEDDPPEDS